MRRLRFLLLALMASACAAETFTWNGAAGDGQFSNPANWAGGAAPPNDGTAVLVFGDAGAGAITLPPVFTASQIQFLNTPAASYTLGGTGAAMLSVQNGFSVSTAGTTDRLGSNVLVNLTGS